MADLARIKRNVAKMAAMNAPEEDIDGYIDSEGVSIDEVRNFKLSDAADNVWGIKEDPRTGQSYIEGANFSKAIDDLDYPWVVKAPARQMAKIAESAINVPARAGNELMRALSSLPLEGVDALAGTNSAESLRRWLPEYRVNDGMQEMGASILQYASPTMAAIKGIDPLIASSPKALQYLVRLGTAAGADFAVTNPDQAGTLGDLIGGPTKIGAEDSPLAKRTKVGAENLVLGPLMDSLMYGAGKGKDAFDYIKDTPKRAATKALQEAALDSDAAIRNITDVQSNLADDYFMPTAGTASDDEGLIALERGLSSEPRMVQRANQNRAMIAGGRENLNVPSGAGTETPGVFFKQQKEGMIEAGEKGASEAQEALLKTQKALEKAQNEVLSNVGTKEGASAKLDELYRATQEAATAEKNAKFAAIDPDGNVMRSAQPFLDVVKQIEDEAVDGLPVNPATQKFIDYFKGLQPSAQDLRAAKEMAETKMAVIERGLDKGEISREIAEKEMGDLVDKITDLMAKRTNPMISFRQAQRLRPKLSDAIAQARANNDGEAVKHLSMLKKAVESETEKLAAEGGEAGLRAKSALEHYKNVYAPNYVKGEGGALRMDINRGKNLPASATADRFVNAAPGAKEAAEDIDRIIAQSADPAQGRAAVKQYVLGKLSDSLVNGKITSDRLDVFLNRYGPALQSFPDVQKHIEAVGRTLAEKEGSVAAATAKAKQMSEAANMVDRELNRSVTELFIQRDPVKAVSGIMNSSNPAENMREVLAAARKDPSGRAVMGVRDAVKEWANDNLSQMGKLTKEGEAAVSFAKINAMLDRPPVRRALNQIYTPDEMAVMDKLRKQLEVMDRINQQVTVGSPTKHLAEAQQKAEKALGIITSIAGGSRISGFALKLVSLGTDPQKAARQLLVDAMLDPDLAKTMLMPVNKGTAPRITKKLNAYITNNILGELTTGDDESRYPDKKTPKAANPEPQAPEEEEQSSVTAPPSLEHAEGKRAKAYTDTTGNRTVGVGFNMDTPSARRLWKQAGVDADFEAVRSGKQQLSEEQIKRLYDTSVANAQSDLEDIYPEYTGLGKNQQEALLHLSYQLGAPKLSEFKGVLGALKAGNHKLAGKRLLHSKYARQVPQRAVRLANMLAYDRPYQKERGGNG